ncbi:MAG TPA: hypothetical protein VFS51_12965 [Gemmatimonadales bacterium]|nr:hypothetical protein [Gemmatimonadales bacterium]
MASSSGVILLSTAVLTAWPWTQVSAEPWIALKTGLKCSACHVNRSGGGGRNTLGSVYAQTQLPWATEDVKSRALTEFLFVGFDLRLKAMGTVRESSPRTSIDLDEAQVYLEARMVRDRIALYIDQTVGPNRAVARELFALIEKLPLNGYAKAGKLLVPYGIRLKDDEEFIRAVTGFNYDTPDQGLEIGIEPGPWSVVVALANGNVGAAENNSGKLGSAVASYTRSRYRLGLSASRNTADALRRDVYGVFGGLRLGPLALLAEADYVEERLSAAAPARQFLGFAEGDLTLGQGLNAKVTYGYHDRNRDVPEDQRIRWRFGLEAFPNPFLQLSGFYILDQDIPQATRDLDRMFLELRLHF